MTKFINYAQNNLLTNMMCVSVILAAFFLLSQQARANGFDYDNAQINDSDASSFSNMSNYQINNNSETRHRVGDVECAAPSTEIGIAGRRSLNSNSMAYVSVNIPFGGSTCKSAQKQRLKAMEYDLHVQKVEQRKKDLLFQEKMASVCLKLHGRVQIDQVNILFSECLDFEPTHGHPPRARNSGARVSPHKGG